MSAFAFQIEQAGRALMALTRHAAVEGRYDTDGQGVAQLAKLGLEVAKIADLIGAAIAARADLPPVDLRIAATVFSDAWTESTGDMIAAAAEKLLDDEAEAEAQADARHQREESRADLFL